jgi:alpha-glucoside transport system substrate-binding protein
VSVADTDYLGGTDAYAGAVPFDQAEVVVGMVVPGPDDQRNLDAIGEKYGLRARLQVVPFAGASPLDVDAQGVGADVYMVSGRDLAELATSRPVPDLRTFIDEAQLLADYGSSLVSLSRVGSDGTWPSDTGPIHGVAVASDSKALVWTKEPEFTDLGYAAPSDWASFMATADAIVADGRTPFCLGLESADATGWPATDWVEMVVLRTAGPDFYDAWTQHDVPFDDPVVVEAIRTIGEMVHRPGYLDVNPADAALRPWSDALLDFTNARCLMTPFPSYLPASIEAWRIPLPEDGLSVGSFPFPTFGTEFDDAVVGGGDFAAPVADRPEIRILLAAMASPDWGIGASQSDQPSSVPVNARFDVTNLANADVAEIVGGLQAAVRSDSLRLDASDNMPAEIGFGAFLDGMVRLFREGSLENLDELSLDIAQDIEAAWLELERTAD